MLSAIVFVCLQSLISNFTGSLNLLILFFCLSCNSYSYNIYFILIYKYFGKKNHHVPNYKATLQIPKSLYHLKFVYFPLFNKNWAPLWQLGVIHYESTSWNISSPFGQNPQKKKIWRFFTIITLYQITNLIRIRHG